MNEPNKWTVPDQLVAIWQQELTSSRPSPRLSQTRRRPPRSNVKQRFVNNNRRFVISLSSHGNEHEHPFLIRKEKHEPTRAQPW
jgi:hypothetical protein